jgi:ParB family chromosome partitioning protein
MIETLMLREITRNPDQPRQHFNQQALEELALSIEKNGLQQPITVRRLTTPIEGAKYQIVMGERRYRAHLLLEQRIGVNSILAHVRENLDDGAAHVAAILENLQREDISPIEEAYAFHHAIEEFGITAPELADRLGITQAWLIPNRLRLLNLTDDNQQLLVRGIINKKQALAMSDLDPNGQKEFLDLVKRGLCRTNASCEAAAERIASRRDQSTMDIVTERKRTKSLKSVEDHLDALGQGLKPLLRDGELEISGNVNPDEAMRCAEKVRLLTAQLRQMERELNRAASESAAA